MIACHRCGLPAPLPDYVHEQYDGSIGGDPDLPVMTPVPKRWAPTEDGSGIVCPLCALDSELVEWTYGDDAA